MSFQPVKVLEVDLSRPLEDIYGLEGSCRAFVLLRTGPQPVGRVWVDFHPPCLTAEDLQRAILSQPGLCQHIAARSMQKWLLQHAPYSPPQLPSWSVVICTRDRPEDLRRCLSALVESQPPGGEIIVVDSASRSNATREAAAQFPVRFFTENQPGLNRARRRGAQAAAGEVVIYTDDDAVPDRGWVEAMLEPFESNRVACVTGLVLPAELETEAQYLFEVYGGFSRGFKRRVFDYSMMAPAAAGIVGAGASMAFRRELVNGLDLFRAELDGGTVTQTGGDNYAFYRLLAEGYQIVYNPLAVVRHRHRKDLGELRRTLTGYSIGGFAFLARCFFDHGDWQALAVALEWIRTDHVKQLARCVFNKPGSLPAGLVLPQFAGIPRGIMAHFAARRVEREAQSLTRGLDQQVKGRTR